MADKSVMQKEFERTIVKWATAAGVPVKMDTININGKLAYYMHPSIQEMWESFGGHSESKGKEY